MERGEPGGPIPNLWSGSCFGCSPSNRHGLRLRFWHSEGGCYTRTTLPEHLCGFDGVTHGGIVAALLDEVSAWAVMARLGRMGVTREITVRYLRPVPTGRELVAEARVAGSDERSATVRATIRLAGEGSAQEPGLALAECVSTWALPRLANVARIVGADEAALKAFMESIAAGRAQGGAAE